MSLGADLVFRSTNQPGYSREISAYPKRVRARKLVREIEVQFATRACEIKTREGLVHARAGDAVVTGPAGERWRVSRAHFGDKYRPVPPTVEGQDGRYTSLPNVIVAVPMATSFDVVLSDGISRLRGHAGDWLVDYGDGSLGIVAPSIFATTYQLA